VQFTVVLLLRHLVTVATVGAANQFAFSLLTVSTPAPKMQSGFCNRL